MVCEDMESEQGRCNTQIIISTCIFYFCLFVFKVQSFGVGSCGWYNSMFGEMILKKTVLQILVKAFFQLSQWHCVSKPESREFLRFLHFFSSVGLEWTPMVPLATPKGGTETNRRENTQTENFTGPLTVSQRRHSNRSCGENIQTSQMWAVIAVH